MKRRTMDKLEMHSPDLSQDNIAKLRELFPGVVTEARDEKTGELRLAVDFDQLRQELSAVVVEGPQERYRLDWPGKREALALANAPIAKTLRPAVAESVNFDTTQNLFIEGDNLDALKLLQESYLNKIKVIYIDPPYNTGSDLIYEDNFTVDTTSYFELSDQIDATSTRLVANTERNGRFHSDWLSFLYPRLKISRNLLREDGIILISIDDAEFASLKAICSEIFGESNFVAVLVWEKGRKNDAKLVSVGHEYILMYCKNREFLKEHQVRWREAKPGAREIQDEYLRLRGLYGLDNTKVEVGIRQFYDALPAGHPSKRHVRYNKVDGKGVWRDDNMSWPGGDGPTYDVFHPRTGQACAVPPGGWRYSTPAKMQQMIKAGKVEFRHDHTEPPIRKTYLIEVASGVDDDGGEAEVFGEQDDAEELPIQVAGSYFYRSGLQASNEIVSIFGARVFNNPKDRDVLARWISYVGTADGDIVLDFFAGSGTTGHAVYQIADADRKQLKYILVQLPEPINPKAKGARSAIAALEGLGRLANIAEISKERLRWAGRQMAAGRGSDVGFRVLKIDSSNMKDVYYRPDQVDQGSLLDVVDNVKEGRTAEDLLFQVLVDWGVDLSLPIRQETIAGKTVFFVDDNALVACFDLGVSDELVKQLAKREPLRVVFRDTGFASDAAKINVDQIFRQLSPGTEVRSI